MPPLSASGNKKVGRQFEIFRTLSALTGPDVPAKPPYDLILDMPPGPWRSVFAFALNGVPRGQGVSHTSRYSPLCSQQGGFRSPVAASGAGRIGFVPRCGRLSDGFGAVRIARAIAVTFLVSVILLALRLHCHWRASRFPGESKESSRWETPARRAAIACDSLHGQLASSGLITCNCRLCW